MRGKFYCRRSSSFNKYFLREVVTELIEEYNAAERPDYVSWGPSSGAADNASAL